MSPRGPARVPVADRFWRKVAKADVGCWEWQGATNGRGYGRLNSGGRGPLIYPHRFSYELHVGPIPEGKELDHLCRNPGCVRPDHLEPVTHRENTLRGTAPAAFHAEKTHCPQNHPYSPENTLIEMRNERPHRKCRTCVTRRARARYRRSTI